VEAANLFETYREIMVPFAFPFGVSGKRTISKNSATIRILSASGETQVSSDGEGNTERANNSSP